MQINNASSSQAVSSSPDANPAQTSSTVTGVTNSSEIITTSGGASASHSPQTQDQSLLSLLLRGTASVPHSEQAAAQEPNIEDMDIDISGLGDFGLNIEDVDFDVNTDFGFNIQIPQPEPTQEKPVDVNSEPTNDAELPSSSGVATTRAVNDNIQESFPSLTQLLTTSSTKPLVSSTPLPEPKPAMTIAEASQARAKKGAARARKRKEGEPEPKRCERLTPVEQKQIIDYSFNRCQGLSLQEAAKFLNSHPEEAFKDILTSKGEPYKFIPYVTYRKMAIKAIGYATTKIPAVTPPEMPLAAPENESSESEESSQE